MERTTQVATILIVLLALAAFAIATQFVRRRRSSFPLRPIAAYTALPGMIGTAVESDRTVHLSLGGASLGGSSTITGLVAAELAYQSARRAALGARTPILTLSEPSALALGYSTLYRAYRERQRLDQLQPGIRWLPAGPRSLVFAAGLTALMTDEHATEHVLGGSFGTELALPLDTASRRRNLTLAGSDQLEGQAVAYVLADYPLIGEELFAAGAYLSETASPLGAIVALDVLRWLLILGLLAASALLLRDPIAARLAEMTTGR